MKKIGQYLLTLTTLLVFVISSEASPESSGFDSTKTYKQIVQNRSDAEVREAISKLSKHYHRNQAAGETSVEFDRELILEAIPIIIDHMDDADKEWATTVFYVLASIQSDCPAPKKEPWQDWWEQKQNGERINWTIRFASAPEERKVSNKAD
ncbi:MAG: hypothetical protein KDN19_06375 [Verrucomicrobiae bacterium]|nr:hypothetical protein [Verrucomicrobiae bacterium]